MPQHTAHTPSIKPKPAPSTHVLHTSSIPMPIPIPADIWKHSSRSSAHTHKPMSGFLLLAHATEVCILFAAVLASIQQPSFQAYSMLTIFYAACVYFQPFTKSLGITFHTQTGLPIPYRQRLLRTCWSTVSFVCMGMGYWWCLLSPSQQTWHDVLARTYPLQNTHPSFSHWRQRFRQL